MQFAIKASKSGAWHVDAAGVPVCETPNGDIALEEGEYELINRVEEKDAQEAANSVSAALPTGGFVILDTELNDDLLAEGYARDVIRAVQEARKAAGLEISDRITLKVTVPAGDVAKIEQFQGSGGTRHLRRQRERGSRRRAGRGGCESLRWLAG